MAAALLVEEDGPDVGQDAALGDGDAGQELVQLFVIPAQAGIQKTILIKNVITRLMTLEVPGDDARFVVVPRRVAGQLEDLGRQVLHDGGHDLGLAGLGLATLATSRHLG